MLGEERPGGQGHLALEVLATQDDHKVLCHFILDPLCPVQVQVSTRRCHLTSNAAQKEDQMQYGVLKNHNGELTAVSPQCE